jgi:hypothetical protein
LHSLRSSSLRGTSCLRHPVPGFVSVSKFQFDFQPKKRGLHIELNDKKLPLSESSPSDSPAPLQPLIQAAVVSSGWSGKGGGSGQFEYLPPSFKGLGRVVVDQPMKDMRGDLTWLKHPPARLHFSIKDLGSV